MKRLILGLALSILAGTLTTGCTGKGAGETFNILLENADDLGSLQVALSYDSSVIEVLEVKAEKLGENALLEFSTDTAGILAIGAVDSAGIDGSGPIVAVSFRLLQKDGESPLRIVEAQAHNTGTLVDIPTSSVDGVISIGEVSSPSISFK